MQARKAAIKKILSENNTLLEIDEFGNLIKFPLSCATEKIYEACVMLLKPYAGINYKDYCISVKLAKHLVDGISSVKSLEFMDNDACVIVSKTYKSCLEKILIYTDKPLDDLIHFQHIDMCMFVVLKDDLIFATPKTKLNFPFMDCTFIEYKNSCIYYEFAGGIYKSEASDKREFVKWIPDI